jgi:hypothetical protein
MRIIEKDSFTNTSLRHQPIEFLVTVAERLPFILQKDEVLLKALLDTIFKLMINIDDEIDESWIKPKEGYRMDEDDEDEDSVSFGKYIIDKLVASVGETDILPKIEILI